MIKDHFQCSYIYIYIYIYIYWSLRDRNEVFLLSSPVPELLHYAALFSLMALGCHCAKSTSLIAICTMTGEVTTHA